ncbi:MlaD family protein [Aeromicrobium sp. CTD01-1L150]|uniref:MlaD family protein n=1 Tax=Aeromicrobium sp. CTD01-1L150 TaxID=3341830 RepID=UPI0035C1BCE7
MLTRRIKIQVMIFVVAALLGTSYLGATYVGINPFSSDYRVTVAMPDSGGTFTNGEVTYRGVPVGRIEKLTATDQGTEAVLRIDADAPSLPSGVSASVANRSAIGEQYVDLRGAWDADRTALADGDRVSGAGMPPPVEEVLRTGRDFAASVPEDSLTTVIDETYELSRGLGDGLGQLVETSQEFVRTADENFLVTRQLIRNSDTVLSTQAQAGDSIRSFSSDLSLIADTLESADGDLRRLIDVTPAAARELQTLFAEVGRPLGTLMANLVSTAQVFGVNAAGVEDALIKAPEALSVGWSVTDAGSIDLGLVTSFFDPLPCTAGYGGTQKREGLTTSRGRPFNTSAGCTASPSSGTNVRGPQSVPRRSGSLAPAGAHISTADSLADLMGGE